SYSSIKNCLIVLVGTIRNYVHQLLLALMMLCYYRQDIIHSQEKYKSDYRAILSLFKQLSHQRSPQLLNDKKAFAEAYALGMSLVMLDEFRDISENQLGKKFYHEKLTPVLNDLILQQSSEIAEGKLHKYIASLPIEAQHTITDKFVRYRQSLELALAIHDEEQQEEYAIRSGSLKEQTQKLTFIGDD